MGRWARVNEVWPDVIITSSAVRARDTADAFRGAGKYDVRIEPAPILYESSLDKIMDLLQARTEHAVMLVGHNPSMEDLVATLTGAELRFVTAAFAWIELPIQQWSELSLSSPGHLKAFWVPRELPKPPSAVDS